MTDQKIKSEWKQLLSQTATGHCTLKMVSEFDRLTNLLHRSEIISWGEFLGAQVVISTAKMAAETAAKAGIEGRFLGA